MNHLTALFISKMSQADTCRSLICVISLLQLHSQPFILDWCCRNKWPQQNYTVNPVSIMDHHCGWPLKLYRFIRARLNLNGILSVSTGALDKGWNWLRRQHHWVHNPRWMLPVMTSYEPPSLKGSGDDLQSPFTKKTVSAVPWHWQWSF